MLEIRNFQFVLYFKGSRIKKFLIDRDWYLIYVIVK